MAPRPLPPCVSRPLPPCVSRPLPPCVFIGCSPPVLIGSYFVPTMAGVLLNAAHSVTVVAQSEVRLLSIHKVDLFSSGDAGVIERLTQVPG